MDMLVCFRRNHEQEGNIERPLAAEFQQEDLHRVQTENAAKQSQFFNAIQNMDIKGIQSFVEDEGFKMKCSKESPSEKEAFHFLAEIENDAISSDEDFEKIFHMLLDAGCQINATDRFGNTPLMLAAEKGNSLVLRLLLGKGADINKTNDAKNGPLHWASKNGKIEAINLLLLNKANVNAQNEGYQTPLHLAVEQDKKNAVRRLIDEGADKNLQDLKAKTPLQYARNKSTENLFVEKSSSVRDRKKKKISSNGNASYHDDNIDESDSKKYREEFHALYKDIDFTKIDPSEAVNILPQNLMHNKHSMAAPPKDAVQKCRYFCSQFKEVGRKDIIEELRKNTSAGMTGPLAYSDDNLVSEMDRCVRRELTHSLCGQETWKFLADELGIPSKEFGYYDRKGDPAEAILAEVCDSRELTVGELYNALVKCDADGLADHFL